MLSHIVSNMIFGSIMGVIKGVMGMALILGASAGLLLLFVAIFIGARARSAIAMGVVGGLMMLSAFTGGVAKGRASWEGAELAAKIKALESEKAALAKTIESQNEMEANNRKEMEQDDARIADLEKVIAKRPRDKRICATSGELRAIGQIR